MGDLAVGSTGTQLDDLVDKWFLGMDHPAADAEEATTNTPYSYQSFAGNPLFGPGGPTHLDEYQQDLGDCYLISSLGMDCRCQAVVHREHVHRQR